MSLKEYKQKRNLNITPEPKPGSSAKDKGKFPVFVVHKHKSRSLHYDLRLELKGVLKSFAIPKGPSLDSGLKRLAVMVEDHPFEYKDFEGIIPQGNYGAGSVIIWDRGFFSSTHSTNKHDSEEMLLEGLKKGDLKFILAGEKLKGEFALVRMKADKNSWLLIKKKDRYASKADILKQGRSVLSNKTIEEIDETAKAKKKPSKQNKKTKAPVELKNAPRKPMPHYVIPMLGTSAKKPFNDDDWIFEIKWDGYRAIAEISEKNVFLYSRNHISFADKFAPIADALKNFEFNAVLDGEIVFVDKNGKPDFQMLQDYSNRIVQKKSNGNLIYYVFDMLHYQGRDLTGLELIDRKELLKQILPENKSIRISEHVKKDGIAFFNAAKKMGIEGIVAKYSKSAYAPGIRSKNWLKIKLRSSQDCVITGFTKPQGLRKYLGSLVLGAFEKKQLVYIGHSGGGFHGRNVKMIFDKLNPLIQETCPFKIEPPDSGQVTWVRPALVCEVEFTGWTKDGVMRQPNFLRFREDKSPSEAILEKLQVPKVR